MEIFTLSNEDSLIGRGKNIKEAGDIRAYKERSEIDAKRKIMRHFQSRNNAPNIFSILIAVPGTISQFWCHCS